MAKKHIHKYIRVKIGDKKKIAFKCSLPGCNHYKWKEMIENSLSICWRCNNPFVIDKISMDLKKPHCLACTKSKKTEHVGVIKELLDNDVISDLSKG